MIKDIYKVIGVMSGTSLDGADLVYVTFRKPDEKWEYEILETETFAYSKEWVITLKSLVNLTTSELSTVDKKYTQYLSTIMIQFIRKHHIVNLDFISSHGHTAWHQPKKGITYQIGNLPDLANSLATPIICDFRRQDVELGGEGAPLVPIGDAILFSEYGYCVNLGGFANLSTDLDQSRIAFDICPVNIVLNHYVNDTGMFFDEGGKIASTGTIHPEMLNDLNSLSFYFKSPPKSLGLEWVKQKFFPIVDRYDLPLKDILRTCCEHFALQITRQFNSAPPAKILFTGGGVYNTFLMNRINELTKAEVIIPSENIIEYKEALIFAFLGVLKYRNEINCLRSVTGAEKDHSSGKIYFPKKNN